MSAELKLTSGEASPTCPAAPLAGQQEKFARTPHTLFTDPRITTAMRDVLGSLSYFDRGQGTFATDRRIGERCQRAQRTTNRIIGQLVALGLVERVTRENVRFLRLTFTFAAKPKLKLVQNPSNQGTPRTAYPYAENGVPLRQERRPPTPNLATSLDSSKTERNKQQTAGAAPWPKEGPEPPPGRRGDSVKRTGGVSAIGEVIRRVIETPASTETEASAGVEVSTKPVFRPSKPGPTLKTPPSRGEPSDLLTEVQLEFMRSKLDSPDPSWKRLATEALKKHNVALGLRDEEPVSEEKTGA